MANQSQGPENTTDYAPGLGGSPKDQWPKLTEAQAKEKPLDRLKPGSELHQNVLNYLIQRLEYSERCMGRFYARWRINELKIQAYVNLPDYEQSLKEITDAGGPPKAVTIVVPYSFATVSTITTYLIHTFFGRKPIFQVDSKKMEAVEPAGKMEIVLQYQAEHTRLVKEGFQFFNDCSTYGVGILRTDWKKERKLRTVWDSRGKYGFLGSLLGNQKFSRREMQTVYEGNNVFAQDPFMFFPDPRVPMSQVNRKGEFVFWREFVGKFDLKNMERQGAIKWVDYAGALPEVNSTGGNEQSGRTLLSRGTAQPGRDNDPLFNSRTFYQIDQGTIEIIPAELGLGEETYPQKWIFSVANRRQIIQAEPFDTDHGMHPVCVSEPNSLGYGFGQPGIMDFIGPLQDTASWFLNSHIKNVRTALNNMFVVDPSMVEMQDLRNPTDGKIIRLKRAAYGQDVRQALTQLPVMDVTANHVNDLALLMKMSDALSMVNDNMRGQQDAGGRKTATEVRTSGEAAASRLASHARVISSQAMVDLTEQMSLNTQQYMSEEFYLSVVGKEGVRVPIHIEPSGIVGDFTYPINDGTLPLDRVAMLDVWKEILMGVAQDPQLRQSYSIPKIFAFVAELGGARNIESFKLQVAPDEQMGEMADKGNVIPLPSPKPSGAVNALPANPGSRLAGGL